jgi:quinol monooxygenase YgiN
MACMIITHNVKDYAEWKKAFDSFLMMRRASGELSASVYRDSTDENKLTIVNKWDSLDNAQKFAHSPELREAMQKAGVMGAPSVSFLNEA